MTSPHTGDASGGFDNDYALMTDGDSPSAALFRVPLEQLADNLKFLHDDPLDNPETYGEIREDFTSGRFDTGDNVLYAQHVWQATEGDVDITNTSANPGQAFSTLSADEPMAMSLSPFVTPLQWGDLQYATIVAGVNSADLADLNNGEAFFGLASQFTTAASLGANVVGLWYDEQTSPNWMIRHKVNNVDDATTTSVPVVRGEFVVCKLKRISATQVTVHLNGTLVATLTDGTTAPDDNDVLTPGMMGIGGTGIALTFTPLWDLIHVRWNTPSRAT